MSFLGNVSGAGRSLRSILVSNIPSEISEEHLKEFLSEFGLILNIRFFKVNTSLFILCEYGNEGMALGAVRNLNNFELKGRVISADIAASAKSKAELEALQHCLNESQSEMLQEASADKAPEEISKAVASLPAVQMFELMKQMKMCIENNPQEARNLLLQNPQLAYALLQAQVIMRIVDPNVAMKILNRPVAMQPAATTTTDQDVKPALIETHSQSAPDHSTGDQDFRQLPPVDQDFRSLPNTSQDKDLRQMTGDTDMRTLPPPSMMPENRPFDPRFRPTDPRASQAAQVMAQGNPAARLMPDHRAAGAVDPRMMAGMDPRTAAGSDPRMMQAIDPRAMPGTDPRLMPGADPRSGGDPRVAHGMDPRSVPGGDPRQMLGPGPAFGLRPGMPMDPRSVQGDPRKLQVAPGAALLSRMPTNIQSLHSPNLGNISSAAALRHPSLPVSSVKSNEEEEKAALIMQVLQLSEEQIALLPPEQRQSIILLKEQIARSQFVL